MIHEKRFTAKGKKMFNSLIEKFGKKKGRSLFYSMEKQHPDWTARWRE